MPLTPEAIAAGFTEAEEKRVAKLLAYVTKCKVTQTKPTISDDAKNFLRDVFVKMKANGMLSNADDRTKLAALRFLDLEL